MGGFEAVVKKTPQYGSSIMKTDSCQQQGKCSSPCPYSAFVTNSSEDECASVSH